MAYVDAARELAVRGAAAAPPVVGAQEASP
jgi:hypothetical protein